MNTSRRRFLQSTAAGFAGLRAFAASARASNPAAGYGPIQTDPEKILNLPRGFSYRVVSRTGDQMTDGLIVPAAADGMAAFPGPGGKVILIRNHELSPDPKGKTGPFGAGHKLFSKIRAAKVYDIGPKNVPCVGGTTTLVFDTKSQRLESQFLSLTGTVRNCAGGPTPWNSWISCEESVLTRGKECSKSHGFNFEVPATSQPQLADPIPLTDMGRFNHEAIAVDPKSGIVYETEDRPDSSIYRFIPTEPGKLAKGGNLQALAIKGRKSLDTRNWTQQNVKQGDVLQVEWVDLKHVATNSDQLRYQGFFKFAARFARGEGMWYGNDAIYFACTSGGKAQRGQIWKYTPSPNEGKPGETNKPGHLELFIEPNDEALVDMADNLTVAPWGHLMICEDGKNGNNLVGCSSKGEVYRFAENAYNDSEFAGATFSPDGSTLFVNIQKPGWTFAITGPWQG